MQSSKNIAKINNSGASITALSVMSGFMIALDTKYGYLFDSEDLALTKHILDIAIASEPSYFRWGLMKSLSNLPYSAQQMFFNRAVSPGYDTHKLARKLIIRNKTEDAIINDGVKEVIFLGVGYDPRPFLLSRKFPNVNFYELDRGQTRQNKLKALLNIPNNIGFNEIRTNQSCGGTQILNDNLYCIECDFIKDNLIAILKENGFKKGVKKLIIAEGLTMYLTEKNLKQLLSSIHDLINGGDELIISFRQSMQNTSIADTAQKASNELYTFSLHPNQVIQFVGEQGFEVTAKNLHQDMLACVGDVEDSTLHNRNQNLSKEHYYILRKSPLVLENIQTKEINDIPDFKLNVPANNAKKRTSHSQIL